MLKLIIFEDCIKFQVLFDYLLYSEGNIVNKAHPWYLDIYTLIKIQSYQQNAWGGTKD